MERALGSSGMIVARQSRCEVRQSPKTKKTSAVAATKCRLENACMIANVTDVRPVGRTGADT